MQSDATCTLAPGAQWLTGNTYEDNLAIYLDRHSTVMIGYTPETCSSGPAARWSCAAAKYSLLINRDSTIFVAPGSAFECNMRAGQSMSGQCEAISFLQGGSLYLSADAQFGTAATSMSDLDWEVMQTPEINPAALQPCS